MPNSRMAAIDHLKYQLPRFAEGQYTLQRMIDVARDRLEANWEELTSQDINELENWLGGRVRSAKGEARLRWGYVRGIFDTVREERGSG
jgi:hypothetical protein